MHTLFAAIAGTVAVAFLTMPFVRHRYGTPAMASAQTELARQGVRSTALHENGMRFDASGHEWWAPGGFAALMVVLAGMNLAELSWARPLNWVVLSLVLLANCVIVYSNRTAEKSVRAAFVRKNDPELARIDVPALLRAAEDGFPDWTWKLQAVRNILVFGGTITGLLALALS
ncbi:hypothetical protein HLB23_35055 [Nocardia uniformis]|uniref:Uncharacterized protein n=1 Tax=Nocardia uniformis TaxID=53432 RepID=A0A849C8U4_9NOCA|nr:hypothetical protein [Nocardia uniformis]NNH75012.1 hypothetical protein [Nocardia uniformis]